jgi:hypothetical protein
VLAGEKGRAERNEYEIMATMTNKRQHIIERVTSLPEELLDDLEESLDGIVQLHSAEVYHASPEELKVLDEVDDEIERGELATDEEVEAAFASFRRR